MPALIVASSSPRVGRSTIAAAIAWRLARDGRAVTLARHSGDESAAPDAATFAAIDGLTAGAVPIDTAAAASLGDAIIEAPPGPADELARKLGAKVLVVQNPTAPAIDVPPDMLAGSIITSAPAAHVDGLRARTGALAVLPEDRVLAAPSVRDVAAALHARPLSEPDASPSFGRVMIGTIASDAAAPYFANREHTCVVTRYDKTDVQLAALQTEIQCLVLTGGGEPSPYLLDRIAGHRPDVAVLLAEGSTVDAVRGIEALFAASRFDGGVKLQRAVELLDEAGLALDF